MFGASTSARQAWRSRSIPILAATSLSASAYFVYTNLHPISFDAATREVLPNATKKSRIALPPSTDPYTLLGWGSNRYLTLSPDSAVQTLKRPSPLTQFGTTPLRDLVLAEKYGACIDARGDCWMWGAGYDPSGMIGQSLKSKRLVKLASAPGKLFAISKHGNLYVVSASKAFQDRRLDKREQGWWSWLCGSDPGVDFLELKAEGGLRRGERWAGVSTGLHHLLAVTNKGRTFSLPLSPAANSHQQLGTREVFDIPFPVPSSAASAGPMSLDLPPETDIRFARILTEIPLLKGVDIAQVAAGDRTSFLRTPAGRVLGFGANEYGQIGLGSNAVVDIVPVPIEVIFAKNYPGGTSVRCLDIAAGGQTTFLTIERGEHGKGTVIDLLACGNGISGTLGNGLWSSATGALTRVKTVSGLQEYSEKTKSFQSVGIHSISISPSSSAHVFAVLDTVSQADEQGVKKGMYGKDVMVWGGNADYQLGNGKRSSLAVPQHLPPLISRPLDPLMSSKAEAELSSGTLSPMPHSRLQLHQSIANAYDLNGKLIRRNVRCEEVIVAGYNASVLYNKILD